MTNKKDSISNHSAGAIIRHKSPFDQLKSYVNKKDIDQDFRDKWVIPYYMDLNRTDAEWVDKMQGVLSEISDEVILTNLGEFNWRSRQTGAYFAAIKNKPEYIEIIGVHLLKSEVCFAGREYAVVLSYFNTEESIDYLNRYLDYYLQQPELPFDQGAVIAAIKCLDEINNSNMLSKHINSWKSFLDKRKEIDIRNHQSWLNSDLISQEMKEKLSTIKFDKPVNYSINSDYKKERIETIKRIQNG